ncbi:MAG: helix-turn-helix transcriptional regulator [Pirellulaceae bacterium]|nr:helix-turn-helix transcriptional regulator [Pirellulaceae bacterium]
MASRVGIDVKLIKDARLNCGLTQKELAKKCGVTPATIYRMEKDGKATIELLDMVVRELTEWASQIGVCVSFSSMQHVMKGEDAVTKFIAERLSQNEVVILEALEVRKFVQHFGCEMVILDEESFDGPQIWKKEEFVKHGAGLYVRWRWLCFLCGMSKIPEGLKEDGYVKEEVVKAHWDAVYTLQAIGAVDIKEHKPEAERKWGKRATQLKIRSTKAEEVTITPFGRRIIEMRHEVGTTTFIDVT